MEHLQRGKRIAALAVMLASLFPSTTALGGEEGCKEGSASTAIIRLAAADIDSRIVSKTASSVTFKRGTILRAATVGNRPVLLITSPSDPAGTKGYVACTCSKSGSCAPHATGDATATCVGECTGECTIKLTSPPPPPPNP